MTNALLEVSSAFNSAVIALMLAEANVISEKLGLPEELPIMRETLTGVFVGPTNLNHVFGGPNGSIRTKRHVFAFAKGGKLTTLGRYDLLNHSQLSDKELDKEYQRRAISPSQVNTNTAWRAMLPRLKAGVLNLDRLNSECEFQLKHLEWAGQHVPKYTAQWKRNGEIVASLTILLPENVLLSLLIYDPSFSLRPEFQLSNTNAGPSVLTNAPSSNSSKGRSASQ